MVFLERTELSVAFGEPLRPLLRSISVPSPLAFKHVRFPLLGLEHSNNLEAFEASFG